MAALLRWTDFVGRDVCGLVGLLALATGVVVLLYQIIYHAGRALSRPRPPRPQARGFDVIPPADRSAQGEHESNT